MKIVQYNSDMGHWDGLTNGKQYEVLKETNTQYVVGNDLMSHSTITKDKFIVIVEGDTSPTAFLEWKLEIKMLEMKLKEKMIDRLNDEITKCYHEFTDIQVELGELNETLRLEGRA